MGKKQTLLTTRNARQWIGRYCTIAVLLTALLFLFIAPTFTRAQEGTQPTPQSQSEQPTQQGQSEQQQSEQQQSEQPAQQGQTAQPTQPGQAEQSAPPGQQQSEPQQQPTQPSQSSEQSEQQEQTDERGQSGAPGEFEPDDRNDQEGEFGGNQGFSYSEAFYTVGRLNEGLPDLEPPANLQTPQAAVEHFVMAVRQDDFERAAHALNLNLVPLGEQVERAPRLAEQLDYVLTQQALINWDELPDRPDGQIDLGANNDPLVGVPRRSISLGIIDLNGRDIDIRVQRIRVGDNDPQWVFSSNTVENIEPLYDKYGPTWLDRRMPDWAKTRVLWTLPAWEIIGLFLFALVGAGIGWGVQNALDHPFNRFDRSWSRGLQHKISLPAGVAIALVVYAILVRSLLTLTGPFASVLNTILVLLVAGSLTWLGMRIVTFFSDYIGQSYVDSIGGDDQARARKMLTYITVARRVLVFIALLFGIGLAIAQFTSLQRVGTSLLASAGVLSVIVGIAAQSVLGNIIAGLQIAITQPVRIGDNVLFEGHWGYIEEITYTYVTIQTWDQRRVIVPLKYFITNPVENWSKTSSHMIKPIYLYVDYSVDVDQIREKFAELLRNAEDWDEEVEPTVQVTAAKEDVLEVRALCSAKDPSAAWNLHCDLREALVKYVRDLDDGSHLPTERVLLQDDRAKAHPNGRSDHAERHDNSAGNKQAAPREIGQRTKRDDEAEAQDAPDDEQPDNDDREPRQQAQQGQERSKSRRKRRGQQHEKARTASEGKDASDDDEEALLRRLMEP